MPKEHGEQLEFNPGQVAFALCSQYKTWQPGETDTSNTVKTRGDLALKFIQKAAEEGYKVVVMDGGSSPEWLERLPENVTRVDFKENNFGKQKTAAILEASKISGVVAIVRTEAEKIDVLNHVIELTSPIIHEQADMVVGSRNESDFKSSYPNYGYKAEMKTKMLLNKVMKLSGISNENEEDLDFYSGMDVFRNDSKILGLVEKRYRYVGSVNVNTDSRNKLDGWFHGQVGTMIEAKTKGLKVVSVPVDFIYSDESRENEVHPKNIETFKEKRKMQTRVAVQPAIQLIRHLIDNKKGLFVQEVDHRSLNKDEFYADQNFGSESGNTRVIEFTMPPKTALARHLHTGMLEIFIFKNGNVRIVRGEENLVEILDEKNKLILIPANEKHIVENISNEPSVIRAVQVILTPGGKTIQN